MWMPERVWEQSYTRDLVAAGMEYTLLDDFHFKNAGLIESQLFGHYLTEDDGQVMSIFPGSERLRYLIPFGQPQETIDYLARIADEHPDSVVVFGDDGEKFGTWPETHRHCYQDRWLERFFDVLRDNQGWIQVTTLAESVDHVLPLGKIYLPDGSYREMTEWALPTDQQVEYGRVSHEMEQDHRWPVLKRFVRGGFWRNFKVKYSEADEMYCRMMGVSRRLAQAEEAGASGELIEQARSELYRGQCNCGYWHGAFGGIYLPHLRNAVYQRLIAADNLLDQVAGRAEPWVESKAEDFNFDARPEVQLANDKLMALIAPNRGGQIYELDVRSICHNLLATLTRRPEPYHRKVLAGANPSGNDCASIHDRVVFKQEGLDQRIQYDTYPRKSLVDLFYENDATLAAVASGQAPQRGDFVAGGLRGPAPPQSRPHPGAAQPRRQRLGHPLADHQGRSRWAPAARCWRSPTCWRTCPPTGRCTSPWSSTSPACPPAPTTATSTTPSTAAWASSAPGLDLVDAMGLGLVDEWLGLDVGLKTSRPTSLWTFPVETVSQSESGFELVHQSVVVQPHWIVLPDAEGCWAVTMRLAIDTGLAEQRQAERPALATAT